MDTVIHLNKSERMIEGCKQNNRRQQEKLYCTYASSMFAICLRYASDKTEAEDILQSGFIKVFEKIDSYKAEGPFEGWIRRIMVNTGIEYFRKNQRKPETCMIETCNRETYDHADGARLEVKDLLKMIQRLPATYRTVFSLHAIEGYSHREISAMLNITELASRTSLCRAREILKRRIVNIETADRWCPAC